MNLEKSVTVFLGTLIPIFAAYSSDISYTCPSGWVIFRNQCYLYVGESKTHSACQDYCQSKGGELLSIWSTIELFFIRSFIATRIPSASLLGWSGLKRQADGEWAWSDGSKQQEFSWYQQPRETYSEEMCGAILGANSQLYPAACKRIMSIFICKREAVVAYELGVPWETTPGNKGYNSSVNFGKDAMFYLSDDVDGVLRRMNTSLTYRGRNEVDCGLKCLNTPGCTAFVYKCRQASGCDTYECIFA